MPSEIFEMEARLKNFISQNLDKINKDLVKTDKVATKSFGNASKASKGFQSTFKGFVSASVAIGTLRKGWAELIQLTSESIVLYKDAVNSEQKLTAALLATHNQIGLSKGELIEYAKELESLTIIEDDTIVKTEALMLTFTQISKEIFPDAIEKAADMSAMFGQDLAQSAIQLGTALNDPIAGVGRLKRIGISFTQQQRDSIKTFVEQNDIMSAQKVILNELEVEFGGVAKALAETDVGEYEQLNNELGNLKELLGKDVLPLAKQWLEIQLKLVGGINSVVKALVIQKQFFADGLSLADIRLRRTIEQAKENKNVNMLFEERGRLLSEIESVEARINTIRESVDEETNARKLVAADITINRLESQKLLLLEKELLFRTALSEVADKAPVKPPEQEKEKKPLTDEELKEIERREKAISKFVEGELNERMQNRADVQKSALEKEIDIITQTVDSINVLRDAQINSMEDGTEKELAIIAARYEDEFALAENNEEAIKNLRIAKKIEEETAVSEIEKVNLDMRASDRDQFIEKTANQANQLGGLLINLSRQERLDQLSTEKTKIAAMNVTAKEKAKLIQQAEQDSIRSARKEKIIAINLAIANTALAVTDTIATAKTIPGKIAGGILIGGIGLLQIGKIASTNLQRGSDEPVGGNSFSGDKINVNLNSDEAAFGREQQAELFRMSRGRGQASNGSSSTFVLNLGEGATISDENTDRIVDSFERLNNNLEEADRGGYLDGFMNRIASRVTAG